MILEKISLWFWQYYSKIAIKLFFRSFDHVYLGDFNKSDNSILMISNHTGWWDGFWNLHYIRFTLKRPFNVAVSEKVLSEQPQFRLLGFVPLGSSVAKLKKSIYKLEEILMKRKNLLLIYPQGKLTSTYEESFTFGPLAERLLHKSKAQLSMAAYFVEYGAYPRPTVSGYYKNINYEDLQDKSIEKLYNSFYSEALNKHIDRFSE
ncbi:MAG: 1-acyl-sn-glycerol-3-phosphate acyltransferase [Bacteroidales bacterium]